MSSVLPSTLPCTTPLQHWQQSSGHLQVNLRRHALSNFFPNSGISNVACCAMPSKLSDWHIQPIWQILSALYRRLVTPSGRSNDDGRGSHREPDWQPWSTNLQVTQTVEPNLSQMATEQLSPAIVRRTRCHCTLCHSDDTFREGHCQGHHSRFKRCCAEPDGSEKTPG